MDDGEARSRAGQRRARAVHFRRWVAYSRLRAAASVRARTRGWRKAGRRAAHRRCGPVDDRASDVGPAGVGYVDDRDQAAEDRAGYEPAGDRGPPCLLLATDLEGRRLPRASRLRISRGGGVAVEGASSAGTAAQGRAGGVASFRVGFGRESLLRLPHRGRRRQHADARRRCWW